MLRDLQAMPYEESQKEFNKERLCERELLEKKRR